MGDTRIKYLELCESATPFTVLGNDTTTLTTSTTRIQGAKSISFAKVDGAANTVYAGVYRTVAWDLSEIVDTYQLSWHVYLSALTDVVNSFIRIGTDGSNMATYQFLVASMTAGTFTQCTKNLWQPNSFTGVVDFSNITYFVMGVEFSAQDKALAGILMDNVLAKPV